MLHAGVGATIWITRFVVGSDFQRDRVVCRPYRGEGDLGENSSICHVNLITYFILSARFCTKFDSRRF